MVPPAIIQPTLAQTACEDTQHPGIGQQPAANVAPKYVKLVIDCPAFRCCHSGQGIAQKEFAESHVPGLIAADQRVHAPEHRARPKFLEIGQGPQRLAFQQDMKTQHPSLWRAAPFERLIKGLAKVGVHGTRAAKVIKVSRVRLGVTGFISDLGDQETMHHRIIDGADQTAAKLGGRPLTVQKLADDRRV